MAYGLHGYAVDLSMLSRHLGGKNLELLESMRDRFSSVIELHTKWNNSHGSNESILPLTEALEWLIISPVTSFDDNIGSVGYALELMVYELGEHVNLGNNGPASLREITTSDLHGMLEPIVERIAKVKLKGCPSLETALVRRSIQGIVNNATYPGTGYLTVSELKPLCEAMHLPESSGPPESWPWYPILLLFHGALERNCDLATFYY